MKVDTKKLYTQSAYGREIGESPQMIKYWVNTKKLKTVEINGAVLIIKEEEK
jgi:hypothetical protein